MSVNKNIAKNSMIHLAGKVVSLVLGLAVVAMMTRYLGKEKFGYYTTIVAFLQFFGIMVDFGLTLVTVQMLAQAGIDRNKVLNAILSFRVITGFCFLALAPAVVWLFPYNDLIKIGVLINVFSFFGSSLLQMLTALYQERMRMAVITVAEVLGRSILVGGVALVIFWQAHFYYILGLISLVSLIEVGIAFIYARKFVAWKWEIDLVYWKQIISKAWPLAISISFNLIYLKMDTIILSLTRTAAEVGLYGATYRVVDVLTMMPAVFMGVALPVLSKYFVEQKKDDLFKLMQQAFNVLVMLAVPIIFGAYVVGGKVMVFVAGNDFLESGEILKVLILAVGAIFMTSLSGYAVVALNKQKTMMWGYMTTAVLTLIGYLVFIPKYGYWGGAWMTVFSETMIMVWTFGLVYRTVKFWPRVRIGWQAVGAAAVMALVLNQLKDFHILILVGVATIVYFTVLLVLGGINRSMVGSLFGREWGLIKREGRTDQRDGN